MPLQPDSFQPLALAVEPLSPAGRALTSYWQNVRNKFKVNQLAVAGLIVIILIVLLAAIGPVFTPFSYADQNLAEVNLPPSATHWLGTDNLGRDLFVRLLYGARISLAIGFAASLINLTIGVLYGGISGYFGGRTDNIMMRIVDILYGIPLLLYVILFMVMLKPGLQNVFLALGLVYWLQMARIVRGQVLTLKEREFVLAAKVIGLSPWRIIVRHIIPNSLGPILVTTTFAIPEAIFSEAFLSFIGLGVSAPMASWGVLASEGLSGLYSYPFQLIFPAVAISITMLSFNFVGDGLRDALDPHNHR